MIFLYLWFINLFGMCGLYIVVLLVGQLNIIMLLFFMCVNFGNWVQLYVLICEQDLMLIYGMVLCISGKEIGVIGILGLQVSLFMNRKLLISKVFFIDLVGIWNGLNIQVWMIVVVISVKMSELFYFFIWVFFLGLLLWKFRIYVSV